MNIKEKIIQDIEKVPAEKLPDLEIFIKQLLELKNSKRIILTVRNFGGKLDDVNARDISYDC